MVSSPRTPQDYRERADECERLAADAVMPATRETMLYLAARWRSLAAEAEAKAQSSLPPDQSVPPAQ
jgi:hypothetical protein